MKFRAELQLEARPPPASPSRPQSLTASAEANDPGAGKDQRAHLPQYDRDDRRGREDPDQRRR